MDTGPVFVLNFTNVTAPLKLIVGEICSHFSDIVAHGCLLHKGVVTLAKFGQNSSIINRIVMHEAPFTQFAYIFQ